MPVTGTAVVVGPGAVRAAGDGRSADPTYCATAALAGIDDDFAVVDGQPVAVDTLWQELFASMLVGDSAVLVCPSCWSDRRIATVSTAARTVVADIEVRRRAAVLAAAVTRTPAIVVEISESFVTLSRPDQERPTRVVSREAEPDADPDAVVGAVGVAVRALGFAGEGAVIDRAEGVGGAHELGASIADRLRAAGIAVRVVDDDRLLVAAAATLPHVRRAAADQPVSPVARPRSKRLAVLAGSAAVAGVVALVAATVDSPASSPPTTLLVEGRVVIEVPADWLAQRITAGPGSARVQVTSRVDPQLALHITQSHVPVGETLQHSAETLRHALIAQPPGVFVDLNADDRRGDRPVVTYREIRDGHDIGWAVLLDGPVRISIGCQSPRGREAAVAAVCDRAVGSARDIGALAGQLAGTRRARA